MSTTVSFDEDMDRLTTLCTHISQMTSRIRLNHLSNISFPTVHLKFFEQELLSISENVEGSAILLESLLALERHKWASIPTKKSRYAYTRDELLKLRQSVTVDLSMQVKYSLSQVVERESNLPNKFSRNIRTILI